MNKPKIGVPCFVFYSVSPRFYQINTGYVDSIIDAGGIPVVIPVTAHREELATYLEMVDGILIPGGEDIAPDYYGEDPAPQVNYINRVKDLFELELIRLAREQHKPIFGICRGLQMLNVALGGTLYQDIPSQVPGSICHLQSMDLRNVGTHRVKLDENSLIGSILGAEVFTNTYHHQAIKDLAPGLVAVGHTSDGIIEAVEHTSEPIFAVQWHPEGMYLDAPEFLPLFKKLLELAAKK